MASITGLPDRGAITFQMPPPPISAFNCGSAVLVTLPLNPFWTMTRLPLPLLVLLPPLMVATTTSLVLPMLLAAMELFIVSVAPVVAQTLPPDWQAAVLSPRL